MPEITPKKNFTREREKINFKVQWFCGNTAKMSSSVSFHQNFTVFHAKFNIRFRRLVLLKINCFEKIFKRALQKFAIQCKWSWYKVFVLLLLKLLVDSVLTCNHLFVIGIRGIPSKSNYITVERKSLLSTWGLQVSLPPILISYYLINCLPHVSINRVCKNEAINPKKKRKLLQYLKGVKSIRYM